MKPGVKLETLSWIEAGQWFVNNPVIVIPLGAAAKEHGPHLPLNNDAIIATWLGEQICARLPVVIAPLINASFYPAFTEYPGFDQFALPNRARFNRRYLYEAWPVSA